MATAVVMPKLGNSVESSIIVRWTVNVGDTVSEGDILAEVETDKATIEVESTVAGTVLATFFDVGDDVPVLTNIAAVGEPGESFDDLRPADAAPAAPPAPEAPAAPPSPQAPAAPQAPPAPQAPAAASPSNGGTQTQPSGEVFISPRARNLAERKGLDYSGVAGTGPGGRLIERDIAAALETQPRLTPVAQAMVDKGEYVAPERGSGHRGRVTARDLIPAGQAGAAGEAEYEEIKVRGVRKLIASRMLESLTTTAQLTMNSSADARAITGYRKRLKGSPEELGLQRVSINDLLMYAVARVLPQFPDVNATYHGDVIRRYRAVHLGFAVDTPRGLIVPVIRDADILSLKQLSDEAKRLANACIEGTVSPDDLDGATFTVTNLGAFGVENFTPVLNPPQVAILGVGSIQLKAVEVGSDVKHIPHMGLSLTIDHQAVDGAPGARFLQALTERIASLDLLLAL